MNRYPPGSYVLVFDTEQYSGSFERELVAYVTGCSGECGVGAEEAAQALEDLPPRVVEWLDDHVLHLPDEHGCCRPASVWPTPGWFNDGHGNHHRDSVDEAVVLARRRASIEAYAETVRAIYQHLPDRGEGRAREHLAKADEPLHRHPAYQSVAVALDARLDGTFEALLRGRAQMFCAREGVELIGHRLLKAGPQIFVAASSIRPVTPQEQRLHCEAEIETFGPVELADKEGSGLFIRASHDSRTVAKVDPPGLLDAVRRMAAANEGFRLGLFQLAVDLFQDGK